MFIVPIKCPKCGAEGRPGDLNIQIWYQAEKGWQTRCKGCETLLPGVDSRDQRILSENVFVRFSALSNYEEGGVIHVRPGFTHRLNYSRRIDFVCWTIFTGNDGAGTIARPLDMEPSGMVILTSVTQSHQLPVTPARVAWHVYGLVDVDKLPLWYLHFCSAAKHLADGFFKPAFLDYAVAFEAFLDGFLSTRLTEIYGEQASKYMLKKGWHIDERCDGLLQLATGKRLRDGPGIYEPWNTDVRVVRNRLAHGRPTVVDAAAAERAHQAVYQAVAWIESLPVGSNLPAKPTSTDSEVTS